MAAEPSIEVVLFDLGGILVELDGMGDIAVFSGESSAEEIWRRWLACPWVRRFERGECDPESFAHGMVESWAMPVDPAAFLEAFAAWPKGLLPGATELVHATRSRLRTACLSNTNAVHSERHWQAFGLDALFDDLYLSHEMGHVKPDRAAFEYVVAALETNPERILFLDDNQINVGGARAVGLQAERVTGVEAARAILSKHRVL
jgi:putative hydrolase of the HAD superfamily